MPRAVLARKLMNFTLLRMTLVYHDEIDMILCGGSADELVMWKSLPPHVPCDAKNAILWYLWQKPPLPS